MTLLSVMFQFLRAFATGVTVYGISIVLQNIVGIPFEWAVLILGVVTIIYDMLGGMEARLVRCHPDGSALHGDRARLLYSLEAVGGVSQALSLYPQLGQTLEDHGHQQPVSGTRGCRPSVTVRLAFWPMLFEVSVCGVLRHGPTQVQREPSSRTVMTRTSR